jgi:hypothetical protein
MAIICLWAGENGSDIQRGDVIEILDDNTYPCRAVELPKFLLVKVEGNTRSDLSFMLEPIMSDILGSDGEPTVKYAHPFRFDYENKFTAAQLAAIQGNADGWLLEVVSLSDFEVKT